jgi:hypothetical protein
MKTSQASRWMFCSSRPAFEHYSARKIAKIGEYRTQKHHTGMRACSIRVVRHDITVPRTSGMESNSTTRARCAAIERFESWLLTVSSTIDDDCGRSGSGTCGFACRSSLLGTIRAGKPLPTLLPGSSTTASKRLPTLPMIEFNTSAASQTSHSIQIDR